MHIKAHTKSGDNTLASYSRRREEQLLPLSARLLCLLLLASCGTTLEPTDRDSSHLTPADTTKPAVAGIPGIVNPVPLVPAPTAGQDQELYTVVAQDVPIRDLLFNMARDAAVNVDVHPDVTGIVTLNAIEQTLPQILERISRQTTIRWSFDEAGNLVVVPDSPYWATYEIDYVNVQRAASTTTGISTSIVTTAGGAGGGAGGGDNNSSSSLTQSSNNNFWTTLTTNLTALLSQIGADAATASGNIVANAESGVVSVRATASQHAQIAAFINSVETRSLYQVLIEATVVEVTLSDQFQSGVNWETLNRNGGELNFVQNTLAANLSGAPANILTIDRSSSPDAIGATIAMLSQFGESRVLSSPKIMSLNNQPSMLRVVDNKVYFEIEVQPGTFSDTGTPLTLPVYTTTARTVPVGFVMTVTPQVGANDQVTLNVRPTISRIVGYVNDPNPQLTSNNVVNRVPEIQVREMESVLKIFSGQVAILGGLMQDSLTKDVDGLPGLSRMRGIRNLFSYRDEIASKTELIIFIRPVVVHQPSLDGDLQDYQQYLPGNGLEEESAAINNSLLPSALSRQSE